MGDVEVARANRLFGVEKPSGLIVWETEEDATRGLLGLCAMSAGSVSFEGGGTAEDAETSNFWFCSEDLEVRSCWISIVIQECFGWEYVKNVFCVFAGKVVKVIGESGVDENGSHDLTHVLPLAFDD